VLAQEIVEDLKVALSEVAQVAANLDAGPSESRCRSLI